MESRLYTKSFLKGSIIFNEGDFGDVGYIVESGKIEVSIMDHDRRIVLGRLGKGSLLGEMALLDDAPRTATATALEDTVLTVIGHDQLHERLDQAEPFIRMLVDVIMERYRSGLASVKKAQTTDSMSQTLTLDMTDEANSPLAKIRLENELHSALDKGELEVFFQPLLGMKTGKWAGFEALTRWNHLEKGFISPIQFIALAEETTLIIPIGLYVLETACRNLVELQMQRNQVNPDLPPMFIAVNVSAKQLAEPEFIEKVNEIVKQTGLAPSNLKLEITESMSVDYLTVINWVRHCKELGFTVAIDDFGTGYSSLEHLLELEVDNLKIDQAFVRPMMENTRALELIRGIVSLAKELDLSVVTEGVETEDQLKELLAMDVDYGQGYFIGKPQSKDDILQALSSGS
ncbi:MAG: EAL domain-containing protein [Gammaproteobacteria bacterium]|nr:MAG: EAL domain-containing protein [Gammaproteobacteria bacterium]